VELLPLIDVVFLLLAVFLYSMVAMVRSHVVPVTLPSLTTGETRALPAVLVVSVDREGSLSVGGEGVRPEDLEDVVRLRRDAAADLAVVVNADREATHGDVTHVFDALRAIGQERVFLVGREAATGDGETPQGSDEGSAER
jgi:biopolymer transport protein ExbD